MNIVQQQKGRRPFALATVIETRGSVSARTSAKALINDQGRLVCGWVGGGCAESATITKALECMENGVNILVVSGDSEARAADAKSEWRLDKLSIGHGLSIEKAREWGLYVSSGRGKTSIGIEEPALFSEPGVFLVRPDQTLYYGATQTMPFARPGFADLLGAVKFAVEKDYPARGEVA